MCCFGCAGILAGCACSFCGSCCCSICARECSASEKFKKGPASRVPYIFLTFLALIFAIVFTLYGEQTFGQNVVPSGVTLCQTQSCRSNGVVYRVSFSLFVFFMIHAVLVHFIPDFHTLWLMIKFICFCLFLTATFFFGNGGIDFFDGWSQFARVASIIFLILQVLVLILWAYGVYDDIIARVDELEEKQNNEYNLADDEAANPPKCNMLCCYKISIYSLALGLIIAAFILNGFFFSWFNSATVDCTGELTLVGITMVYLVITLCMTCSGIFENANEFVLGIVDLYVVYLLYSALSSNPRQGCNTVFGKKEGSGSFWLGIFITAAALSYLGFGVSRHHKQFENNTNNTKDLVIDMDGLQDDEGDEDTGRKTGKRDPVTKTGEGADLDIEPDDDDEPKKKSKTAVTRSEATGGDVTEQQAEEDDERKANVMFHACMALAAIYICMLYTNWGTNVSGSSFAGESHAAMWVNITAQWITFVLFMWTLIGPTYCKCLPAEE